MAYQQNFNTPSMQFESEADVPLKQKWDSVPTVSENSNGCFECNICLDSSHDPVVTLCGHLYCWPCIYKWLQVQNSSYESDEQPKCPVCKSYISTSSLVPLYGRGISPSESEPKKQQLDLAIPHRPPALGMNSLLAAATSMASNSNHQNQPNPFLPRAEGFHEQQYFSHPIGNYGPTFGSSSTTTTSFYNPTISMFGEMVLARMFGSPDASLLGHPHGNSYPFAGNGSPRLRRQEMHLDKSLNRVSIFLFCCIVLCLILF